MVNAGTYNISFRRGDTYEGQSFTFTDTGTGDPIAITSGRAQVRDSSDKQVHSFTVTISGAGNNVATLSDISQSRSASIPSGVHNWDLELTLVDGRVRTYITGTFTVTKDTTL